LVFEHTALVTKTGQQVDDEERQPANDKHAHHDTQRLGGLFLTGQLAEFPAQREVLLELMGARVTVCGRRRSGGAATSVYAQSELHPSTAAASSSTAATGAASSSAAAAATAATSGRRRRQHFGAQPLAPGLRDGRGIDLVVREHHD